MTIAVAAAALLLQSLPAPRSVQWEIVGEGGTAYDFIDPATVVREGDIVHYTSRLTSVLPDETGGIRIMVIRNAPNCRTGRTGFSAIDGYDAEGRLVVARQTPPADILYREDSPGPRAPLVHRRVCGAAP
ncbi:MAG TPA: hypothetical protein VGO55_14575 [Allosphingosinicella sp.]|jgi:hypothetical protein|nr:hypothetical protein [Allosphingosinicella sp.]